MIQQSFIFILSTVFICFMKQLDGHGADPARVLLISFDGFRWDYLQKTNHTKNFNKIIQNGVLSVHGLKNAFITKTLPNHYTLVTGVYEETHGMVGNTFFDPLLNRTFRIEDKNDMRDWRWFDHGAEPIWVTNQKQGTSHRSGSVFWVGSAASVDGIYPTKFMEYDQTYPFKSRVDKIVKWFNDDDSINLGLLYFEEPDHIGHEFGPDSPEVAQKIGELDDLLGYLLEQLEKYGWLSAINIIVTSDHGMAETPKEKKVNLDDYINVDSYSIFTDNPIADIHPKSKELEDEIYKNLSNVPHLSIYRKDEIPLQYHYSNNRRIGPLLAVAEENYWISHNHSGGPLGEHGYNNSLPSMHPFFIAMGPAFKKKESVDIFNNVDVYPLLCHILKLKPAPNNGSLEVVKHLLADPSSQSDSFTFSVYMLIIVFTGLVSGVFGVAVCHISRSRRLRPFRKVTGDGFTKLDILPLIDNTSDEDFDLEP